MQVGQVIAVIETEGEGTVESAVEEATTSPETPKEAVEIETQIAEATEVVGTATTDFSESSKFYSPLVKILQQQKVFR